MNLPLITRVASFPQNIAIADSNSIHTYQDLLDASAAIATTLLNGQQDLDSQRVAFLVPSGFAYGAVLYGIWRSGGIAVPLCVVHPRPELEYVITNAAASIIIAHPDFADQLQAIASELAIKFLTTTDLLANSAFGLVNLPDVETSRPALILYTSGTTGKPKGVVLSHYNLEAQIQNLVTAWAWQSSDRILLVLPLHHIHGIVNVLLCALWVGAECVMMPKFEPKQVWAEITRGHLTLFMAVPTIYVKLISFWQQSTPEAQAQMSAGAAKMRLMVSGSAALPQPVLKTWQEITGHFLLERYGMTEIGMALSNPLDNSSSNSSQGDRQAGYVGKPLPNVEVRLIDGEIQVKGAGVFQGYWQNPTAKAFTEDGWFMTGDLAVIENDNYRILGRISVDIIKTGGYKVSALEIEEVLRQHPQIIECAVVGIPDPEWGEQVAAVLVLTGADLTLAGLREWAKHYLAVYKVPKQILVLPELPRNQMGKVTKPDIKKLFLTT